MRDLGKNREDDMLPTIGIMIGFYILARGVEKLSVPTITIQEKVFWIIASGVNLLGITTLFFSSGSKSGLP
jgi:hypothetical protein